MSEQPESWTVARARKAGKARWADLTPEERSERMAPVVQARGRVADMQRQLEEATARFDARFAELSAEVERLRDQVAA